MSGLESHEAECDECAGTGTCADCEHEDTCHACDGEGRHYWPDFEAGDISQCTDCKPDDDVPVMGCGTDNEEWWLCRGCWVERHRLCCGCERWDL